MNHKTDSSVWPAEPRQTVQVTFLGGNTYEAPIGTSLNAFIQTELGQNEVPVVAALVDGALRELSFPIIRDVQVQPLLLSDSDGVRIYRRSLAFLLVAAVRELFPEAQVYIDHTIPSGGFFCHVRDREPFSIAELERIETRMRDMVDQDLPITREKVPLGEVVRILTARQETEKVRLLAHRNKDYLTLYDLNGVRDYFHGYMVPSTGALRYFRVENWPPGFVLRYPRRHRPTEILDHVDSPQLTATFRQYGEWLRVLHLESVSDLNSAMANDRIREVILVSEALHEQQVAQIARQIVERRPRVRLVLIAGPSSAGKTTFSKRLSIQLLSHGVRPFPLELDNYFVERDQTPRDAEGNYDFEALEALDLQLFNEHLMALMRGDEIELPRFNFHTGLRETGSSVHIGPDHIIIVEGIHGLNPKLVTSIPAEYAFRIFASALTQLNIDRHNRVPTTDTRLLRRIVRDATYRGYTAEDTLQRWESVRRGEKNHIMPYQDRADVLFNSALVYELSVLKPLAEPLLLQVEPESPRRVEAKRLLAFLSWFQECGSELIPDNSILREFVGGSILRDYTP
ncbi:MAG: nucleoside kinase [Chloroflexi bacterium]|nr:nucleoside kinase [Chloroflexota bacterium]